MKMCSHIAAPIVASRGEWLRLNAGFTADPIDMPLIGPPPPPLFLIALGGGGGGGVGVGKETKGNIAIYLDTNLIIFTSICY